MILICLVFSLPRFSFRGSLITLTSFANFSSVLSYVEYGKRNSAPLSSALLKGQAITAKPVDIDLNGSDGVCVAWRTAGHWITQTYHKRNHSFIAGPTRVITPGTGVDSKRLCIISVGKRILTNTGRGQY